MPAVRARAFSLPARPKSTAAREAGEFPLRETLDLRPATPYGASKAAAETVLLAHARGFDLDVVVARAFNHIGPGQNERFVVSSLAAQLAARRLGRKLPTCWSETSVRRAIFSTFATSLPHTSRSQRDGESGEVYNVCSGKAVTIRDVLRELIAIARVPVEVREDPLRFRSAEIPLYVGDPQKLRERTGWQPAIPLVRSLRDVYAAAQHGAGVGGHRE